MKVPNVDKELGIEVYATSSKGIGGAIRRSTEDFVVEEVLVDGSRASVVKDLKFDVLGASVDRQRFLLCVLVKRNWDMLVALRNLANQLGIAQEHIQVAGIKDAKAVTAQYVTIKGVSIEEAEGVRVKDLELRPLGYLRSALSSFYLLGNCFGIRITEISSPHESLDELIENIVETIQAAGGIPNFFGHQRFGTTRPITHLVGKLMIKGAFEPAAMLFLAKPSIYEHPDSRQARIDLGETRDFLRAFKNFPKQLRFERLMLSHLAVKPEDFVGAFRRLPIKLRRLFVQGYQSYVFNRFLTARIKNGLPLDGAETGDFVVRVMQGGLSMVESGKIVERPELTSACDLLKAGKLRVALPLVGFRQKLSQGAMGELERQVLQEEDVEAQNFDVKALPESSAHGGLRTVTCPVRDFEFKSSLQDVSLKFMLMRGSYATILLREIMKPPDPVAAGF